MEKTKLMYLLGLVVVLFIASCTQKAEINSFEDCVAAGNPVMESYPRQCSADGKTFTEVVDGPIPVEPDGGIGDTPGEEPEEEYVPPEPKEFVTCTEEQKQNEICTMEYMPVCGFVDNGVRCITEPCQSTNAVTYGNKCGACAAKAYGYYEGACEELEFVVCNGEEAKTGFSPEEYAKNYGGICVDVCPGNYDPYMTQIGVTLCIEHYGTDEIKKWETCTKSTESCNCVKAYETTDDKEVENPDYRCVPERYASRLLFRGGQDRLDENGEQSVMIA